MTSTSIVQYREIMIDEKYISKILFKKNTGEKYLRNIKSIVLQYFFNQPINFAFLFAEIMFILVYKILKERFLLQIAMGI